MVIMETDDDIFDISHLNFEGNFDEQVEEILEFVRLTRDEVESLQLLLDDLQSALEFKWRGCEVKAFGSIVAGLGIKTSDVDIFVSLPKGPNLLQSNIILQTRNILRKQSSIFKNAFAIVGAKVPIVKFYHVPTRRNCDVSFKSPAGVENSKLLTYFMQRDKRVLQLTVLVKYWSKIHNLTGTNLMPNYCLTLLVIFYLQQQHILPPVKVLQRFAQHNIIDHWNVSYEPMHCEIDNNDSLYALLGGFFKYYSTFNYDRFIISPFLGHIVDRDLFKNVENVPKDFVLYRNNVKRRICKPIRLDVLMCVQDSFEHNRNCAVAVHHKLAQTIITHLKKAAQLFEGDENSLLEQLLTKTQSVNVKPKPNRSKLGVRSHGIGKHYKNVQNRFKNNLRRLGKETKNRFIRDLL